MISSAAPSQAFPLVLRLCGVVGLGLFVANCSSGTTGRNYASREIGAFPESKYGPASPRVVADGDPVPKGGGRYLLGKTYSVAGRSYTPREKPGYSAVGLASWYGDAFHGRRTANGEVYDMASISAAHPTLPLPSYARVTNLRNHASMIVRVNDRGPFHGHRIMDVSERVAHYLDFKRFGTAQVRVDYLGPASIAGSDDRKLVATLRTNGDLAPSPLGQSPVLVASAEKSLVDRAAFNEAGAGGSFALASAEARPAIDAPAAEQPVIRPAPVVETAPPRSAPLLVAANVPLPPDRPYDVGTGSQLLVASARPVVVPQPVARPAAESIQVASLSRREVAPAAPVSSGPASGGQALGFASRSSVPVSVPASFNAPANAQMATLYYAQPEPVGSRFGVKGDPLARVKSTGLVPFAAVPTPRADLVVTAGVFREEANARRLAGQLGRLASMKTMMLGNQAVYVVSVGPFRSQAEAEAARAEAVRAGARDAAVQSRQG